MASDPPAHKAVDSMPAQAAAQPTDSTDADPATDEVAGAPVGATTAQAADDHHTDSDAADGATDQVAGAQAGAVPDRPADEADAVTDQAADAEPGEPAGAVQDQAVGEAAGEAADPGEGVEAAPGEAGVVRASKAGTAARRRAGTAARRKAGEAARRKAGTAKAGEVAGREASDGESELKGRTGGTPAGGWLRRVAGADLVRTTAVVCVMAAAVAAAWFGWGWHSASRDDSIAYAKLRDRVLQTGEQAVVNLNTLDYRDVEGGLRSWQDSATADLYNQIVQGRSQLEKELAKTKTASSARVLESALLELDSHAGKAGLIVAVQITVVGPDGKSSVRNSRLLGQLTKTASGWKLSALGQAPTGS